jgi:aspartate 1-decarboxylase
MGGEGGTKNVNPKQSDSSTIGIRKFSISRDGNKIGEIASLYLPKGAGQDLIGRIGEYVGKGALNGPKKAYDISLRIVKDADGGHGSVVISANTTTDSKPDANFRDKPLKDLRNAQLKEFIDAMAKGVGEIIAANATGIDIRTGSKTNQKAGLKLVLGSKIHGATVTEANMSYTGSIGIDEDLVERAGLMDGEKVLVADLTSGTRLETYVIIEKRGSGIVCMNGPSARVIQKGDVVIIMGFELSDSPIEARKVLVDKDNKFAGYL